MPNGFLSHQSSGLWRSPTQLIVSNALGAVV